MQKQQPSKVIMSKFPNGGGDVERFATVSPSCSIDRGSLVEGEPRIDGKCSLINTLVQGQPVISNEVLLSGCRVGEKVHIIGRMILPFVDTEFYDNVVVAANDDMRLRNSKFYGNGYLGGSCQCNYCDLHGNYSIMENAALSRVTSLPGSVYTITGNAILLGIQIPSTCYIHEGRWASRPPRVVDTPYFAVTECVEGKVNIGCQCRKLDVWLRTADRWKQEYQLSDSEFETYLQILKQW